MTTRQALPARRESVTQKIRVGHHQRTIYLTTDTANPPRELFVRIRGIDVSAETIALYDVIARVISVALQHGTPLETIGRLLEGVKFEPSGIISDHPSLHFCSSIPDAIGKHLLSLAPPPEPLNARLP